MIEFLWFQSFGFSWTQKTDVPFSHRTGHYSVDTTYTILIGPLQIRYRTSKRGQP